MIAIEEGCLLERGGRAGNALYIQIRSALKSKKTRARGNVMECDGSSERSPLAFGVNGVKKKICLNANDYPTHKVDKGSMRSCGDRKGGKYERNDSCRVP